MIDVERLIRRDLDDLVALPPDLRPDWDDVQRRVSHDPAPVRRRRRRPLLVLAIVVLGVAIPFSALAVTQSTPWSFFGSPRGGPPGYGPAKGATEVVLDTGTWDGESWAFTAWRTTSGGLCLKFGATIDGRPTRHGAGSCGPVPGTAPRGQTTPYEIGGMTGGQNIRGRGGIRYSAGFVVESATEVAIHLSNGTVIRTPAVEAPAALGVPVRFYVAQIPDPPKAPPTPGKFSDRALCRLKAVRAASVAVVQLVGLDATGHAVATGRRNNIGGPYLAACNGPRNFPLAPTVAPGVKDRSIKPVLEVAGAFGTKATLAVGTPFSQREGRPLPNGDIQWYDHPARCWHVTFTNGRRQGTCSSLAKRDDPPSFLSPFVEHVGRAVFVFGNLAARSGPAVTRVVLRFQDGRTLTARPIAGVVVFAIPEANLSTKGQRNFLTGYDSSNRKVGRESSVFYMPCSYSEAKGLGC